MRNSEKSNDVSSPKDREVIKTFFNAMSTTLLAIALLVVSIVWILPLILGVKPITVLSGSMEPSFSAGDVIWVDPKQKDVSMGEIIVFQPEAYDTTLVTHRVISANTGNQRTYITQGDANNTPDKPIVEGQIVGTVKPPLTYLGLESNVIAFPKIGYLQQHLLTIGIVIVGLALIMWAFSALTEKLSKRGEKHNEKAV